MQVSLISVLGLSHTCTQSPVLANPPESVLDPFNGPSAYLWLNLIGPGEESQGSESFHTCAKLHVFTNYLNSGSNPFYGLVYL